MTHEPWWKNSVVYQIYPKSFFDSNGDGIGDLQGMIEKLDYLVLLGVDALWLSPVYGSPGYDNGYDICDYDAIAPEYGSMADFRRLLAEAHRRNLRVVMDLVVNHTSSEHPWFLESRASRGSERRSYYIWKDGKDGSPPNNWGCLFGDSAWTLDEGTGQYYLHLFSEQQPDLNWETPALRAEIYAMMRRWLDLGVDGFRMDVISLISKRQDFPDGPLRAGGFGNPRPFVTNGPRVHEFLHEMREKALAGRDVLSVGEAAGVTLEEAKQYTAPERGELDMVFQFEHMDLDGGETFKWNERRILLPALKEVLDRWQAGLEGVGWNALFWCNHDQPRIVSRLGDEGEHRERSACMLAACLYLMKGTPFLFQGEELGMTNMPFSDVAQLRDPESLHAYRTYTEDGTFDPAAMMRYLRAKSRDNARTPMQWSAEPNAGFTTGTPWMDVNQNYRQINAEEQMRRPDSVFRFYQRLIALRKTSPIVRLGSYRPVLREDPDVYAYERRLDGTAWLVVCNFQPTEKRLPLPAEYGGEAQTLLSNVAASEFCAKQRLQPYECIVLETKIGGEA